MTAVGWLFIRGEPVYHAAGSAERYAHIYGPVAFMAHGLILGLFGPSITASKWLGAGAALASLGLLFLALRSVLIAPRSMALTGICATLLLGFRNYSFWTRPEPLQLFCVAAGAGSCRPDAGVGGGRIHRILCGDPIEPENHRATLCIADRRHRAPSWGVAVCLCCVRHSSGRRAAAVYAFKRFVGQLCRVGNSVGPHGARVLDTTPECRMGCVLRGTDPAVVTARSARHEVLAGLKCDRCSWLSAWRRQGLSWRLPSLAPDLTICCRCCLWSSMWSRTIFGTPHQGMSWIRRCPWCASHSCWWPCSSEWPSRCSFWSP